MLQISLSGIFEKTSIRSLINFKRQLTVFKDFMSPVGIWWIRERKTRRIFTMFFGGKMSLKALELGLLAHKWIPAVNFQLSKAYTYLC